MHTSTLIIGGGLTGLSLAYQLQKAGHDYHLIEARDRLGGRIKSLTFEGAQFDLGPSWIWHGQERMATLLAELKFGMFEQWSEGLQLYEQPNGDVMQNAGFMSMAGSMRIAGGTSTFIDALVARLDRSRIETGHAVTQINDGPSVTMDDGRQITADTIVLCIPPRLAAQLTYAPALPENALSALAGIPTWMGAHAKFVAVYPTPFWRENGLSGDASSRRGPLVEIHDASPKNGQLGGIFGFVGLPADARVQAGPALQAAAIDQLANLFGPQARSPIVSRLEDWSQAAFTAAPTDAVAPAGHPPYAMPRMLARVWDDRLIFAVTELTSDNGGLLEGALAAADTAANKILGT